MPQKIRKMALFISLITLIASLVTSFALAQAGGTFDLTWSTIDGGGGRSSGGSYLVSGTIGQADAGALNDGSNFTLNGGFWQKTTVHTDSSYLVYLPMVSR
jgi:hypothetical protein